MKSKRIEKYGVEEDIFGMYCSNCGTTFMPGWETGVCGNVDPCPWISDLPACHAATCWWAGSVPGVTWAPGWLDCCNNLQMDWTCFCVFPD